MRITLRRAAIFLLLNGLVSFPALGSDVYFSPEGGIRDQIIRRINTSRATIDVAVYSFTSGEIAQALADAAKRGVRVRVIRDAGQSRNRNDENDFLARQGIPIQIRSGKGRGVMHDKFAIFDGKEVFVGSYNWTANAEHNNWENALFTNEKKVVDSYTKEFTVLWGALARTGRKKNVIGRLPFFKGSLLNGAAPLPLPR
ncbi:MAG: phospholipase D-like domain-containing protein [Elusimicrobiota bacterium]|jgi:phosphatidylserine/phosphatidylglycerophosphate/cardiolipin synthase-like enzyme